MNPPRILATSIAAFLALSLTAFAQTWDGGGADINFNTATNWNTNAVPANNGTASLIFAGVVRLTPSVNVNFDVSGVTFNNTAGAFSIGASGGSTLTVRGGGITNNDADTQTFGTPVTFATGSAITATSGDLNFSGTVGLGTNTVTVSGGFDTDLDTITGTGVLVKNGAGALNIAPSPNQTYGLTINSGTVTYTGSAHFLGTTAAISLVFGTLSAPSGLTLSNATLDVSATAAFTLGATRTMTVQAGGDAVLANSLTTADTAIYRASGPGSTFTTGGLSVRDGALVEVLSGGAFTTTASPFVVGTAGTAGTMLVDGAGSSFTNGAAATANVGNGVGSTGTLTFSNGATGSFLSTSLTLGATVGNGTMVVKGGAAVTRGRWKWRTTSRAAPRTSSSLAPDRSSQPPSTSRTLASARRAAALGR